MGFVCGNGCTVSSMYMVEQHAATLGSASDQPLRVPPLAFLRGEPVGRISDCSGMRFPGRTPFFFTFVHSFVKKLCYRAGIFGSFLQL